MFRSLKVYYFAVIKFVFFCICKSCISLKAIKLTIASLYPKNEVAALAVYFIAPIIVLIIFLFIGNLMRRYIPNVLNIVTGGRT